MQVTQQSLRPSTPPTIRIRRLRPVLAVTVPLFGLAAGLIGYVTVDTRTTAAHNDPAPAASVSSTATLAPDPVADPSPSASASVPPASAADYQPGAVAVKVDGPGAGGTAHADSVPFTVTWSNTTKVRLENVTLNVFVPHPCGADGTAKLQWNDGGTWKDVPSDPRQLPPVSLDPGAAPATQYRIQLTGTASAQPFPVTATAQLLAAPGGGAPVILGQGGGQLPVALDHQLTAAVVSGPGDFHPGGSKSQLVLKVANPTGSMMTSAAPTVIFKNQMAGGGFLQADRLTVEAEVGGGWRALSVKADPCGGDRTVYVDTSGLAQDLPAGGSAQFTLRFGYNLESQYDTGQWKMALTYGVGATAAGQSAATVDAVGYMTHWPGDMTPPSAAAPTPSAAPSPSADAAPSGSPTH